MLACTCVCVCFSSFFSPAAEGPVAKNKEPNPMNRVWGLQVRAVHARDVEPEERPVGVLTTGRSLKLQRPRHRNL